MAQDGIFGNPRRFSMDLGLPVGDHFGSIFVIFRVLGRQSGRLGRGPLFVDVFGCKIEASAVAL